MPSKKSLDSLDYKPANIQFVTNHPEVEKCVFRNLENAEAAGRVGCTEHIAHSLGRSWFL